MTKRQALAKAVKLFGKNATVSERKCSFYRERSGKPRMCSGVGIHLQPCSGGVVFYQIGRIEMGGLFNVIRGHGMTWEAAFEQYAEREQMDHDAFVATRKITEGTRCPRHAVREGFFPTSRLTDGEIADGWRLCELGAKCPRIPTAWVPGPHAHREATPPSKE